LERNNVTIPIPAIYNDTLDLSNEMKRSLYKVITGITLTPPVDTNTPPSNVMILDDSNDTPVKPSLNESIEFIDAKYSAF